VPDTVCRPELSFERVYREHFAFVWRSLRRLGVSEADTADVAQEVFLVVHRKLSQFEGRGKLTTWLFRTCLNVARDHARRARTRREVQNDAVLEALADPAGDAETSRARDEGLALLDKALATMSWEYRTAFVLFELEGMSTIDISEVLEIPLGTVYSRLRRARELFEKALKKQGRAPLARLVREDA
jgi:RNA polymerase sigma-70 factor (ECF subfamily)